MVIGVSTVKRAPDRGRATKADTAARICDRHISADACGRIGPRLRSRTRSQLVFLMIAILHLVLLIIRIYIWILIAQAILSWLLAFGVINRYNRGVAVLSDFLYRVTEPLLRPIRSILPNFGGIDISPVILILILYFLSDLIVSDIAPAILY
jgi:YggT family protein